MRNNAQSVRRVSSALDGIEPSAFWGHFEALTRIPRATGDEARVIEHVSRWAAGHGLPVRRDATGNVLIEVRATAGREAAPIVTLQGHLDMVCERRPDSPNDAAEGRIGLLLDGDWLKADGTTLGADDGVAIAAMMALVDAACPHGPLGLLMTVAEEVGMVGANGLDPSLVVGSTLLNLDSEEDGCLTVGCAGCTDTWIGLEQPRAPAGASDVTLEVRVSGCRGGHSGVDIGRGRANAIKVLGRVLHEAAGTAPFRLVSLAGGKSRNAIPRDAVATCMLPGAGAGSFREALLAAGSTVRDAFATTDAGLSVAVSDASQPPDAWTAPATGHLLDVLAAIPSGPLAVSTDFDGVVETSSSLGEALTEGGRLTLHSLSRSSNDAALGEVIASLQALARLGGGSFEVRDNYGGWRPDLSSPVLAATSRVYEGLFGEPPRVTAMHAGLEPAVIGRKLPGLDMLSLGPQIEAPHSPDERISLPSVVRFWRLLLAVLDDLSAPHA